MSKAILMLVLFLGITAKCLCQSPPWLNPLRIATSTDGKTFNTGTIFQDSSGVPCLVRWKGDTLVAVFQWFRQPNPSASWDRVAVKFSYDNGVSWTDPTPIEIKDFPSIYQRPFDPTLAIYNGDSIRIYYSSSDGMPKNGADTIINTYSARSGDGIHYIFEPGPRVDVGNNRVIDPAVVYFNNSWHYISPVGAPQQGAFHYISPDGINFMPTPIIQSDNTHNWTGNYMIENPGELRFYGSGQYIWYNSSPNGGVWNGYINTNVRGGDPSVIKVSENKYIMIYVGQPHTEVYDGQFESDIIEVFPNPATDLITIKLSSQFLGNSFIITDQQGRKWLSGVISNITTDVATSNFPAGFYYLILKSSPTIGFKIVKK